MNLLYRLLLTFNSTSLLIIVFLVQNDISFFHADLFNNIPHSQNFLRVISFSIYFLIPLLLTYLTLSISFGLSKDKIGSDEIIYIENANDSFLPSYLGYFFVGLSVSSFHSLFFVYIVLFIFTLISKSMYFNPYIMLCGFRFYNINTKFGNNFFLITKVNYKTPTELNEKIVHRINNFTFIELRIKSNESDISKD